MQQLRETYRGVAKVQEILWLMLPGGKTLTELAEEGGYFHWNEQYLNAYVLLPPRKNEHVAFEILRLNSKGHVLEKEVISHIAARGKKSVSIYECLAFGARYPQFCRSDVPLVALGRPSREGAFSGAFYLHGTPEKRMIGLSQGNGPWAPTVVFLLRA